MFSKTIGNDMEHLIYLEIGLSKLKNDALLTRSEAVIFSTTHGRNIKEFERREE